MPMTPMQVLAQLDTGYIDKHNANYAALEAVCNLLLDRTATLTNVTNALAMDAMFGEATAFIGAQSYAAVQDGTKLTIGAGYAYRISTHTAVEHAGGTDVEFSGQAAATYYVKVNADGNPAFSATNADALWEVTWNGSAFTAVTRYAPIVWGEVDFTLAQTSAALSDTFERLVDRLEAAETSTQKLLAISVTSSDVTPAAADFMQAQFFDLSGTLTGDRSVIVPDKQKFMVVSNGCSGAYTVTFKTSGGSGIATSPGEVKHLYCTGSNVIDVTPGGNFILPLSSGGTYDASEIVWPHEAVIAHSFPADLVGSAFNALTAPSDGNVVVKIYHEGSEVGTITFNNGSTTGTCSLSGGLSVAIGEKYYFQLPATADAAFAGMYLSLKGSVG